MYTSIELDSLYVRGIYNVEMFDYERWPKAHENVPKLAFDRALNIIKGPYPEGLVAINKVPEFAYKYCKFITKERAAADVEAIIGQEAEWAYSYSMDILGVRWSEIGMGHIEDVIGKVPKWAYKYCNARLLKPWSHPEIGKAYLEDYFANDAYHAIMYNKYVLNNMVDAGKKVSWNSLGKINIVKNIAKTAETAYLYAFYILETSWASIGMPEVEKIIATDAQWAYSYGHFVLKTRFPLGEDVIYNNSRFKYMYEKYVLDHDI